MGVLQKCLKLLYEAKRKVKWRFLNKMWYSYFSLYLDILVFLKRESILGALPIVQHSIYFWMKFHLGFILFPLSWFYLSHWLRAVGLNREIHQRIKNPCFFSIADDWSVQSFIFDSLKFPFDWFSYITSYKTAFAYSSYRW
jgi:hypothetical protein